MTTQIARTCAERFPIARRCPHGFTPDHCPGGVRVDVGATPICQCPDPVDGDFGYCARCHRFIP